MDSDQRFRKRLVQYPAGTTFRILRSDASDPAHSIQQAKEYIEAAVRESGHQLMP